MEAPETTRFGLSEDTRRAIFRDPWRVTKRASIAAGADDVHPIGTVTTLGVMNLNTDFKRARLAEWDARLAAHEVVVERLVRFWPMAAIHDTATATLPCSTALTGVPTYGSNRL